ncbi:hypothetical protein BDA96_10G256500 [Sorghum bicolor]|jgi:hypothetical protein|uniref:Uncharacterized protein n=2 Tax=Sorghum bicolor TaxID=4558 RepID=A0A921Q4H1_SORBI|nr:uncharacterized protein LOC8083474 [Sorghum bicolor]EER88673.1 hypothetical protein SORBI_3010G196600 [Sorghum bicolor]KAG0515178.1 hypothetical protein BDA96_10G256500 [Sorghum bicolor]|eukprot:XP_002437306.1 uncharacterized protein LOC8083474 [Sorghum bicolor]
MGSGLSSSHRRSSASLHQPPATSPSPSSSPPAAPPALVIAADGSLREFTPPAVSVSDALALALVGAANADGRRSFFVCSADALYFDADVPALGADELLRPGQMYFVLPAPMLGRPLSAADMAALAVRASQALAAAAAATATAGPRSGGHGRRRPRGRGGFAKTRVVPAQAHHHAHGGDEGVNEKLNQRTLGGFETTASRGPASNARKSAVAARPAPPVRRALSTIEEDAE